LSSVVIKSTNQETISRAVVRYVAELRTKHPEIIRVIWFGSRVTGIPLPGSDVDLCLILSDSDKLPHERISDYLPVGFPVGVDLFVYTQEEFERLKETSPGWFQAITSGCDI
jgi:predicted nucleotidyltransferase